MTARAASFTALLVGAAAASGCFSVAYRARRAPLGEPSWPATRAETVTTWESTTPPGAYDSHYEKGLVPTVTRAGYDLQERRTTPDLGVLWGVRMAGGAGVDVLGMMWSPVTAPRCQAGHPVLDLLLERDAPTGSSFADPSERQVHWERPVTVRGERVLYGRFDEDKELLRRPSVIDIQLVRHEGGVAREVCVRVPVTGPDLAYWSQRTWSGGTRVSWRNAQAFTSTSTATVGLSVGRWVGPVRVGVEGLFGGTNGDSPDKSSRRGTALCFVSPGPDCDAVHLGGVAVEASGIAARWGEHWGLGWSLAYEAFFASLARLDPVDGTVVTRSASSGGPRVGLQLLAAVPDVVGVSRFSPTSAWGLELFAAAPREWSGAANGARLTFGVSVLGF